MIVVEIATVHKTKRLLRDEDPYPGCAGRAARHRITRFARPGPDETVVSGQGFVQAHRRPQATADRRHDPPISTPRRRRRPQGCRAACSCKGRYAPDRQRLSHSARRRRSTSMRTATSVRSLPASWRPADYGARSRTDRSRSALPITLTEDRAMAIAASAGESIQPKAGNSTPAAIGMPTAL